MWFSKNRSHENFDRIEKIKPGSERAFGLTLAFIFFLIGVSALNIKMYLRLGCILTSSVFLALALIDPNLLRSMNLWWYKTGIFLNKIISPIILFLLFYLVFTPLGFILKFLKKDVLSLKLNKKASSYWIKCFETNESSMKDQF